MDYATIAGAVTASVGAVDSVTKLVGSVRDMLKAGKLSDADVKGLQEKVSNLFDVALTAKAAQFDMQNAVFGLQSENDALKGKIAHMEAFDAQADDYELKAVSPNSFAYLKKGTPEQMGKTPYLCVPCFDERRKSVLQYSQPELSFDVVICPKCGTTVRVPVDRGPAVMTGPVRRSGWDYSPFDD